MSSVRNSARVRSRSVHVAGALAACSGAGLISLGSLAGCFSVAEGVPPPLDRFYYPTSLVVSPGQNTLYVVNSDFDLQYSGGTVQALDLAALRTTSQKLRTALNEGAAKDTPDAVSLACQAQSPALKANDNVALYPGPCSPVDAVPFVKDAVVIGAFASDAKLIVRPEPCKIVDPMTMERQGPQARLFISVRGDPSVTYFDVPDDRPIFCDSSPTPLVDSTPLLACGAESNNGRCATSHLVGKDPSTSQRDLTLEVDPYGLDIDERGESVVVAHQTQAGASLIVNDWDGIPALQFFASNLSVGPTDIGAAPIPLLIQENHSLFAQGGTKGDVGRIDYTPAFVVSYRAASEFGLLRFENDLGSSPPRPFLSRGATTGIATTASSFDSRGVKVDGSQRRACELACGDVDRKACLRACVEKNPLGVYLANRAPAALVIGRVDTKFTEATDANGDVVVTGAYEIPSFYDSVPLAFGTSHVELGHVVDKNGQLSPRIFAVTFDSRFVFSYDPEARRIDAIIRTGRGPHAITFDSGMEDIGNGQIRPYSTMYVSHFTDSYVGVVDLDMNNVTTFGSIYMTLGTPVPPKGSQ